MWSYRARAIEIWAFNSAAVTPHNGPKHHTDCHIYHIPVTLLNYMFIIPSIHWLYYPLQTWIDVMMAAIAAWCHPSFFYCYQRGISPIILATQLILYHLVASPQPIWRSDTRRWGWNVRISDFQTSYSQLIWMLGCRDNNPTICRQVTCPVRYMIVELTGRTNTKEKKYLRIMNIWITEWITDWWLS